MAFNYWPQTCNWDPTSEPYPIKDIAKQYSLQMPPVYIKGGTPWFGHESVKDDGHIRHRSGTEETIRLFFLIHEFPKHVIQVSIQTNEYPNEYPDV